MAMAEIQMLTTHVMAGPEAQLITSQIPAIPELAEVVKTQWATSHHAQNARDVYGAAKNVFLSSTLLTKILTVPFGVGLVGAEAYELSWKNENKIAEIATERFVDSGGQDILDPMRGVAAFTGNLEAVIGIGAVIALHKYRPAMDVIRKRYFAEYEEPIADEAQEIASVAQENSANTNRIKKYALRPFMKAGKIWGLAFATGALGVTTIEDASRTEYSLPRNIATASAAAGILALNNAAIAGGVLYGVKTNTPYLSDGLMNLAELFKTPWFVASLLGGGMLRKATKERKRIKQKWAHEAAVVEQHNVDEAVDVDQVI